MGSERKMKRRKGKNEGKDRREREQGKQVDMHIIKFLSYNVSSDRQKESFPSPFCTCAVTKAYQLPDATWNVIALTSKPITHEVEIQCWKVGAGLDLFPFEIFAKS